MHQRVGLAAAKQLHHPRNTTGDQALRMSWSRLGLGGLQTGCLIQFGQELAKFLREATFGIVVLLNAVGGTNVPSGERLAGAALPNAGCIAETQLAYQRIDFLVGAG